MPYIKEKNALFFSGIIVLVFLFFPFGGVWASEITSDQVIQLVNESRLSLKENILVRNDLLTKAAEMKVDDIFKKGYFAHTSPEGKTPWVWFDKAGYDYEYAGENLAIHFTNAELQHKAWMESPTHRKNILNSQYREIGVAVRRGVLEGRNTLVTVQEFGSQMGVAYTEQKVLSEVSSMESAPVPVEKEVAPILIPNKVSVVNGETLNRTYEQVLILFWGVMVAQVLVLGLMLVRSSKTVVFQEEEKEYKIPVRVENV